MFLFLLLFKLSFSQVVDLNRNVLEDNIESKRKLILSLGIVSILSERINNTDYKAPKNGVSLGLGFEIFRDALSWDFYYSYFPLSKFNADVSTSIKDFGFDIKGSQPLSRFYSLFGTVGVLSRQESVSYSAYSVSGGIDFSTNSYYTLSTGMSFKSAFIKQKNAVASKSSSLFIKINFNI